MLMPFPDLVWSNRTRKVGTVDSLLADTSIRRTLLVGPCRSLVRLFDSP